MEKELMRLDNFVIKHIEDEENGNSIVVRDVARTWQIEYREGGMMYDYLKEVIAIATTEKSITMAIDATFHVLYALSTSGIHDAKATNDLCDAHDGMMKRLSKALNKLDADKDVDAKDWVERQKTMNEMAEEIKKEQSE